MIEDLESSENDHRIQISDKSGADSAPSDASWEPIEGPFGGIDGYRDPNPADINDAEVPIDKFRKKGRDGTGTGSITWIDPKDCEECPEETLSHELKHAWDIDRGQNHHKDENNNGIRDVEEDARRMQNQYNEEMGRKIQDEYGEGNPVENPTGPPNVPIPQKK